MSKVTLRELDKLVCKYVYKEPIKELNQKGGFSVDCMAEKKSSPANEPIYAMDMVYDYRLKEFSKNKDYIFDLITILNQEGKKVEISQLDDEWAVSSWFDNYEKQYEIKHLSLSVAICLLTLKVSGYNIENLIVEDK